MLGFLGFCYSILVFSYSAITLSSAANLTIGLILPENLTYMYSISKVLPAVLCSIDEVNSTILSGKDIHISVIAKDSRHSDIYGPLAAIEIYDDVNVFFGPIYGYAVASVAKYSPYWNVPVITPGAPEEDLRDRSTKYQLLTRISATYMEVTLMLRDIAEMYAWRNFGLYYHSLPESYASSNECYTLITEIKKFLHEKLGAADVWSHEFDETNPAERLGHAAALKDASNNVRCMFFLFSKHVLKLNGVTPFSYRFLPS